MAARKAKSRRRLTAPDWLTPARKREILGSGLVALGVATLAGFFAEPGVITAVWVDSLRVVMGWAALVVPFLLFAIGASLVLDAVDGQANLAWERVAAALVAFLGLLALSHLVVSARPDAPAGAALAGSRAAGGWIGFVTAVPLEGAIGTPGAAVAFAVLGLVALAIATGLTMRELAYEPVRLGGGALAALRRAWEKRTAGRWQDLELEPAIINPYEAVSPPPPPPPEEPVALDVADVGDAEPHQTGAGAARWRLPDTGAILEPAPEVRVGAADDAEAKARLIEDTLAEFGVPARVVEINRGPTITQFGVEPGVVERAGQRSRVKVSRIVSLQNDLALALAASPIRVLAPVPGRPFVGIEVPNAASAVVTLRGVMETDSFRKLAAKGGLPVALGRDTSGHAVAADLAQMPHLLIAGATGSGKSVALNAIVATLLLTHTPATLKLLLVDPKRVELAPFRGLPHLAAPVIVDADKVTGVLEWIVREMERRYKLFAERGARHLAAFNQTAIRLGEEPLPFLVLVVDELADLMMVAPDEIERLITRLAQLARATGIHLIIATQRPSVDVVTGLIKANFPSRIAFAVASSIDSRVILDSVGADKLLGRGDMLYMASDSSKLVRLQGCFVSDAEIRRLTAFWQRATPETPETEEAVQRIGVPAPLIQADIWDRIMDPEPDEGADRDPLWDEALAVLREHRTASTSFLQRKLRIGYSRAARLMDSFEAAGYVGAAQGNQGREVLFDDEERAGEGERALVAIAGESLSSGAPQ